VLSVIALLLAVVLGAWYSRLQQKSEARAYELKQNGEEWASVSKSLEEARRQRAVSETFIDGARRVAQERNVDPWTPLLRSIAVSMEPAIDLRVIRLLNTSDKAPEFVLRIEAVANGTAPRMIADHFRQRLQEELASNNRPARACQFELLEDESVPDLAEPNEERARFIITAPINPEPTQKPTRISKN